MNESGMITIYLCDDEKAFSDIICKKLTLLFGDRQRFRLSVFNGGDELIKQFRKIPADAVLLDIDMPSMTGFEAAHLLKEIKEDVYIIFITSHDDMVFESYEYHPFWFLRKSRLNELDSVIAELREKINADYSKKCLPFDFNCGSISVPLDLSKIVYFESYKHDIYAHGNDGFQTRLRCTVSDAERQLMSFDFLRIQSGIIVNCRFISKVTSRAVILNNGKIFNISRTRTADVRNKYQEFVRRTLL